MDSNIDWLSAGCKPIDAASTDAARARQDSLTKPPGALGELERVAIRLAGMQRTTLPRVERVHISVFAADHGVVAEGISAFPQAVTAEMVKNFARGGAAISVLARALGAKLEVINLGTAFEVGALQNVRSLALGRGTANFVNEAAMTPAQFGAALEAGADSVERAQQSEAQLYIGGDMGIGNTTAAAAVACALLNLEPRAMAGPGTGLDAAGVKHKSDVIQRALDHHAAYLRDPREALRRLGGFEIAALTGAYIRCAQLGVPVLVDGFIASAAALAASRICAGSEAWWLFAHRSLEPGHAAMLAALRSRPLLDLEMRLGEGSGAAVAVPLLRMACELHSGMATFAEAGVSGQL